MATAFGQAIRDLVQELTDDKRLPKGRTEGAAGRRRPPPVRPGEAIRIADKIANVRDVTHHPPAHWDLTRRREYLDWTEQVVAGCRGVNPPLEEAYDRVLSEGRRLLGLAGSRTGILLRIANRLIANWQKKNREIGEARAGNSD